MKITNPTILLVDDDEVFRRTAIRALERRGFSAHPARNGEEALRLDSLHLFDAAVLDLRMPGMDGIALLKELHRKLPNLPVIILTGHGDIANAIKAIQSGAFHYMTKPCDIQELQIYLNKAIEQRTIKQENLHLRDAIQRAQANHGIVGESAVITSLLRMIERVKDAQAPVLVLGESGTGKELVARALHDLSVRKRDPFVALNCATLKPELLENELFGHVAGAFTGATQNKEGLLAVADKGTLFIDEIADMNPNVQASLLRVIETGEYRPLGSTAARYTRTRIIAAANRDLAAEVRAGRFREDLYYRLNVLAIHTPPLREHLDDIELLVESYLRQSAADRRGVGFSNEAIQTLRQYEWPGNVRELFNICERAVLLSGERIISVETVRMLLTAGSPFRQREAESVPPAPAPSPTPERMLSLDEVECDHIRYILEQVESNVSRAADILKIDRRTLQRKMKRYGIREG